MIHARNIEELVERQMRLWELREKLSGVGGPVARLALVHLDQGPWITLSRQLGSGGAELGARPAERLAWQLFDHEILAAIARQENITERLISDLDEHAVGQFNQLIARLVHPDLPSQPAFLRDMMRVIWTLARKGKAVLVGRGANWFLEERFGLRVRVVADRAKRVARLTGGGLGPAAAAGERIDLHDTEQRAFVLQALGKDIDDPLGYDLVLNLGTLDLESATQTTLTALHRKLGDQN